MHDLVIVGVPLLAIVAGILFNRNDYKDLRAEIGALRFDMHSESATLRTELRAEFRAESLSIRTELRDESSARRSESSALRSESSALRSELRAEMATQHAEVLARLTTIEADLRQFFQFNGRIEGRLEALEKRG